MKYIRLHATILVYSITSILIKLASGQGFMSKGYILLYGGMIFVLGLYALLWQQVIKLFDPSVAYCNKSVTTIWTIVYGHFIFGEEIHLNNIVGAAIIIGGIVLANREWGAKNA